MREYLAEEFGLDARAPQVRHQHLLPARGRSSRHRRLRRGAITSTGGNDQVPRGLADRLPEESLHLDAPLEALWRRRDGSYGLRFGGVRSDVVADRVVLAIPFTTLREVDLGRAALSQRKRECIQRLGMGTNAKLLMQFRHRLSRDHRWNGELTTDRPFLDTWDSSLTQPGEDRALDRLLGRGSVGAGYAGPAGARAGASAGSSAQRWRRSSARSRGFGSRTSRAGPGSTTGPADRWSPGLLRGVPAGPGDAVLGRDRAGGGGQSTSPGEQTSVAYQGFPGGRCGVRGALRARGPPVGRGRAA